jgi:dTDP-4-dehydrorhamnose 3,5-epimerase
VVRVYITREMDMANQTVIGAPSVKDAPTVNAAGESIARLPDGVGFRRAITHVDDRGSVCELFDPRWQWHPDPLVFVYMFTLRPGMVKGWGLHKLHEDRYLLLKGEMEIVMYDVRPESSTRGLLARVVLSEIDRRLMNIPAGIWHANHNIGSVDALVVNFPTRPYDHDSPDKYRLPLDTDQIPHKFCNARGW